MKRWLWNQSAAALRFLPSFLPSSLPSFHLKPPEKYKEEEEQ
jgi:hypothetical protein